MILYNISLKKTMALIIMNITISSVLSFTPGITDCIYSYQNNDIAVGGGGGGNTLNEISYSNNYIAGILYIEANKDKSISLNLSQPTNIEKDNIYLWCNINGKWTLYGNNLLKCLNNIAIGSDCGVRVLTINGVNIDSIWDSRIMLSNFINDETKYISFEIYGENVNIYSLNSNAITKLLIGNEGYMLSEFPAIISCPRNYSEKLKMGSHREQNMPGVKKAEHCGGKVNKIE